MNDPWQDMIYLLFCKTLIKQKPSLETVEKLIAFLTLLRQDLLEKEEVGSKWNLN